MHQVAGAWIWQMFLPLLRLHKHDLSKRAWLIVFLLIYFQSSMEVTTV